jgi:hypothetical protein
MRLIHRFSLPLEPVLAQWVQQEVQPQTQKDLPTDMKQAD